MQHKNLPNLKGFTLIEICIIAAIIALLAAIALPNFLRSRKRAQASQVIHDLRTIDSAIDQYTIENNKGAGDNVAWTDIKSYLKTNSMLYHCGGRDILGHVINGGSFTVDSVPRISNSTYNALSDIAPVDFWSPFY